MKPSRFVTIEELEGLADKGEPFDVSGFGLVSMRSMSRGEHKESKSYAKTDDSEGDIESWSDFVVSCTLVQPRLTMDKVRLLPKPAYEEIFLEGLRRSGLLKESVEEKKDDSSKE